MKFASNIRIFNIIAVISFIIAAVAVIFDVSDVKVYPTCIAIGLLALALDNVYD